MPDQEKTPLDRESSEQQFISPQEQGSQSGEQLEITQDQVPKTEEIAAEEFGDLPQPQITGIEVPVPRPPGTGEIHPAVANLSGLEFDIRQGAKTAVTEQEIDKLETEFREVQRLRTQKPTPETK